MRGASTPSAGDRPTSSFEDVGGLRHHVLTWDGGGSTTVLWLHGWLDFGRIFTATIEALRAQTDLLPGAADLHCVAFDWRGHGETAWAPPGSYYHFADYVKDAVLLARRHRRERLIVVAHSMGAMVASLWLGARPADADALVMLEGLGPPVTAPAGYVQRMRQWLDETAPFNPERFNKPMRDLAHVQAKLARLQPRIPADRLAQLAAWATRATPDGARVWRYDPLHRTRSPVPFPANAGLAFWDALDLPVLWLGGAESVWVRPDVLDRLARMPRCTQALVPDAGHALQNDQPAAVAAQIARFIARSIASEIP